MYEGSMLFPTIKLQENRTVSSTAFMRFKTGILGTIFQKMT